jgi:GGDEF domain-containing protein
MWWIHTDLKLAGLILQTLEIRMRDALRHNDILTHVGGGEFLFILINRGSSEELIGFYQSIARVLTQPVVLLNESMRVHCIRGDCQLSG